MKPISILILLFFLFSCKEKNVQREAGVIRLNPEEPQTLVVSDYFKDFEAFSFNGVLYNRVNNFIRCKDRYIVDLLAFSEEGMGTYLYAFDLKGDSLYNIGNRGRGPGEYLYIEKFLVNKDGTIGVISNDKYLKYSLNGDFLGEYSTLVDSKSTPKGLHVFGDSIFVFEPYSLSDFAILTPEIANKIKNSVKDKYFLNLYSLKGGRYLRSYTPLKDCMELKLSNFSYVFDDTLCYFNEFENCIYNVFPDTLTPRYYIDRGTLGGWTTSDEYRASSRYNGLGDIKFRETDRYVIGSYCQGRGKYYYFIYDKSTAQTSNFNAIDDDILGLGYIKNKSFPSMYFREWFTGNQFDKEYLYFSFPPTFFVKMTEKLKSKMDESQWADFKEKHADYMRMYERIDDESSDPILIGYRFK